MRKQLRSTVLSFAGEFKRPSNGIHILNGHYISRDKLNPSAFLRQLQGLSRFYKFITIQEAVTKINAGETVDAPLLSFTFDDGFEECYHHIAPALSQFGTNAAFFVLPGALDGNDEYKQELLHKALLISGKKFMNWTQIEDLHKSGFVIGSHTLNHVRLNIQDTLVLRQEIIESKSRIENVLGGSCQYFAYPYGKESDFSNAAREMACNEYPFVFSGDTYGLYKSAEVFNRRHFEGDWPLSHMNYFLSTKRMYP
jgi:peptidoglycan/xylan/chitin deacetylase (PgdA/CDA1 family)